MLDLNRMESRSVSTKDKKNIELCRSIIGEHLQSYYDKIREDKERKRKRSRTCNTNQKISFSSSTDDSDSSEDDFSI